MSLTGTFLLAHSEYLSLDPLDVPFFRHLIRVYCEGHSLYSYEQLSTQLHSWCVPLHDYPRHALSRFYVSGHSYEHCSLTSSMVWACGLSTLLLHVFWRASFSFFPVVVLLVSVFSVFQATSLGSKTTRELLASSSDTSMIRPRITVLLAQCISARCFSAHLIPRVTNERRLK